MAMKIFLTTWSQFNIQRQTFLKLLRTFDFAVCASQTEASKCNVNLYFPEINPHTTRHHVSFIRKVKDLKYK